MLHLLHELAHELAPVTPWFCGFVCVGVFCLLCFGGFALVGVWFLFGGDFITAFWPATVHF